MSLSPEIAQRMDALRAGSQRFVLVAFLQDRLDDAKSKLMQCTKETFDAQKGRCVEIESIIKYLEKRENNT